MIPKKDEVLFTALGGAGEIGMNMYAYGHAGAWLAVDCGVSFGDPNLPGIDVFTADPSFLDEEETNLAGLIITHAHEDHIGGVAHLWPFLRCPVYVTPFAAEILKGKLRETDFSNDVPVHVLQAGSGKAQIGPFSIELINMSHSIPEPQSVLIKTKIGNLLHTGDWKIDRAPQIGQPIDEEKLRSLGVEGLLAVVGDSTNAMEAGYSPSEAIAKKGLAEVITRQPGRVAIGCFATNVARVQSIGEAAKTTGRSLVLAGRSLHRVTAAAKQAGYLQGLPEIVPEENMRDLPADKVLMIVTGSQGEGRAALSRIASDTHPSVFLEQGDTVIFSSRVIPGNETEVGEIQNKLTKRGIQVISESDVDETVHVTGHPMQGELSELLNWTRPKFLIPVHGEWRHMAAHASLGREHQVEDAVVGGNGAVIRINSSSAQIIDRVYSGKLALDGERLIDPQGPVLPQRRRLARAGVVSVAVAINAKGRIAGQVTAESYGCLDREVDGDVLNAVKLEVEERLECLDTRQTKDNGLVEKAIVAAAKRVFGLETGKKPMVLAHIIRL
ncbi:MAG: ribonuclease J [Alphaproteobacteria bacterium]